MSTLFRALAWLLLFALMAPVVIVGTVLLAPWAIPLLIGGTVLAGLAFAFAVPIFLLLLPFALAFALLRWLLAAPAPRTA